MAHLSIEREWNIQKEQEREFEANITNIQGHKLIVLTWRVVSSSCVYALDDAYASSSTYLAF